MQAGFLILGVDPGLRRTGYAVISAASAALPQVVEAGVVRLTVAAPLERRLLELQAALSELFETHAISALACEQLYSHYKHPRTAILMGHARGVVLTSAAQRDVPVFHVSATHAKRALTGAGHAGKQQMQRAVALALGLRRPPHPSDVADAIAIAVCGAARYFAGGGAPVNGARRQ